jgi:hypothetical protein
MQSSQKLLFKIGLASCQELSEDLWNLQWIQWRGKINATQPTWSITPCTSTAAATNPSWWWNVLLRSVSEFKYLCKEFVLLPIPPHVHGYVNWR